MYPLQEKPVSTSKETTQSITSIIVAVAVIISLSISLFSADVPIEVKTPILIAVPLLAGALLVSVLYGPLQRYLGINREHMKANRIARKNISALLDYAARLERMSSTSYTDTIASAIENIRGNIPQAPNFEYFQYHDLADIVQRLVRRRMSYFQFAELCSLLNNAVTGYTDTIRGMVIVIRNARDQGHELRRDLIEAYRLQRTRYINFLDSLMDWGKKIERDIGISSDDLYSPYASRIHHFNPPAEL